MTRCRALTLIAVAALGAGRLFAEEKTTQPATQPSGPTVNATLTEWVIFVGDPYAAELNRKEIARNTLPAYVGNELRDSPAKEADKQEVMPIGVIRLVPEAGVEKEASVDVALGYKAGRALGSWPAAKVRASGLLWQDLKFAGKDATGKEDSWIGALRAGPLVQSEGTQEPFLLYDVAVTYPVGLQLSKGKDANAVKVVQPMEAPMLNLTLYRWEGEKWAYGSLEKVAKTPGSVMRPVEKKQSGPPAGTQPVRVIQNRKAATGKSATTGPTTQSKGTELVLSSSAETDEAALAPWQAKLAETGVSAGDQGVALKILARYALDKKRMTAVYRMDPGELDKLLPLEVVPQPKKISRIALVVLTGVDPAIENELDDMIAKLGSPSWKEREAAMAALTKAGAMARDRLERATKDKDVEIAYRAEQLLETLNGSATPAE